MTDIDDILLAVADPEASARFYSGLLGRRPLMAGPDRALFMMRSGRALGLMPLPMRARGASWSSRSTTRPPSNRPISTAGTGAHAS